MDKAMEYLEMGFENEEERQERVNDMSTKSVSRALGYRQHVIIFNH